ncbi:MAG: transposase [Firmicutes bacterium]|nr:transposase [Bacillota bacterium]
MNKNNTGYNYGITRRVMQLKIDEAFAEKVIPADDSVRLLDQIVEEINISSLERAYEVRGRKPATDPSTMLKIMIYANMENIYSSRDIARACSRDINFIWLLNGSKAPNHSEIARFRSQRLSKCAEELFYEIVKKLYEEEEIRYDVVRRINRRRVSQIKTG